MRKYLSLIKFSHSIFAMPFAFIGFFLAMESHHFKWITLLYIILCMIFARSAAMAFNRYIDRDIDKLNPRTSQIREIPNGIINASGAIFFILLNSILFIITTYFINTLCFILSPITLLLILGYSYTKRFTFLCHFILGLSLSLSTIGAYISITSTFDILPLLFSASIIFWVSGFDIIYSLQDKGFDKKNNLYSLPSIIGKAKSINISKISHMITILILSYTGSYGGFGIFYWIGFLIFASLIIYQHILIKRHNLNRINLAFFTTNGIASIIFGIFVISDLLIR